MNIAMLDEPALIPEHFETREFIDSLLGRGWHWSDHHDDRLVHPHDDDVSIQYDRELDKLSASPKLDAWIKLVILTPAGKSKSYWRRSAH